MRTRAGTVDGVRLVLRGARWPADVAIEAGRVAEVGVVAARDGDQVLDVSGDVVTAGLVNTHHHLYQWLTRGRAVGSDLFSWLVALYPIWGRIEAEDVRVAARVGLAELALSGCTTAFDHHYLVPRGDDTVFDVAVDAAREVGVRLHLSRGSMDLGESDGGLPPDDVVEDIDAVLTSTARVADAYHDGDRVSVVVAPCSPFSVTVDLMRASAEFARTRGLRLHTHLAETMDEVEHCQERFGGRPLEVMDAWGWLADDVWYAHAVHLDAREVGRLARAGAAVAHCPSSNARLAAGTCPVSDLVAAGATVGLGCDGPASNEVGALFPEMRQALYAARLRTGRADALLPADALRLATEGGARCLGRDDVGRLEPGMRADLAVWPAEDLVDVADPLAGLVLGPDRRVRHLLVDGAPIVTDGQLTGLDLRGARADLARRAARLH
ncbi:MAG: 8-oxoguanine deaminase [Actinomycetes bacterium]